MGTSGETLTTINNLLTHDASSQLKSLLVNAAHQTLELV
jgi:hypothetical protein